MRQRAITRDEERRTNHGAIATLPKIGCQAKIRRDWRGRYITYSPIKRLWLPLVRKLKVEMPKTWGSSPHSCIVCGTLFFSAWRDRYPVHYVHPLCSDRCAAERRNVVRRRRRHEQAEERQKDLSDWTCLNCGGPVHANRNTKRYCSVRCRVAAHRTGRN